MAVGQGGTTLPPEITIFMPSPTLISSGITFCSGTNTRNPLVGLGVVGTNTFTTRSCVLACASPPASLVTNPMAYIPVRGNSTSTTRVNIVLRPDNNVWLISFMKLYVRFNTGIRPIISSLRFTIRFPIIRRVTQPTSVVNTTNNTNAATRYSGVNILSRNAGGNMKSVTQLNNPTKIITEAATGTTTNSPARNDRRNFVISSFMLRILPSQIFHLQFQFFSASWYLSPMYPLLTVTLLAAALPQQAYIWQRHWDDALLRAISNAAPVLDRLVVLNAEVDGPRTVIVAPRYDALPRRVGLALRANATSVIPVALATNLLAAARAQGLAPSELQIDFDSPESKLDDYRRWLIPLRDAIAPTPLTITALPCWLRHETEFHRLVAVTDGFVLQVHSVDANTRTLCDTDAARRAIAQASRFGKPFRVALPTYTHPGGLRADPVALAALVRELNAAPPANLTGILWYRLPTDNEKLNWRWPTLAAVMDGKTPCPDLVVETRQTQPGLVEIDLLNRGNDDALAIITIAIRWRDAMLSACDALAGFDTSVAIAETNATRFVGNPRLAPGQRRTIGWLRFRDSKEVVCETRIE